MRFSVDSVHVGIYVKRWNGDCKVDKPITSTIDCKKKPKLSEYVKLARMNICLRASCNNIAASSLQPPHVVTSSIQ